MRTREAKAGGCNLRHPNSSGAGKDWGLYSSIPSHTQLRMSHKPQIHTMEENIPKLPILYSLPSNVIFRSPFPKSL